jgi:hypothetical protein
MLPRVRHQGLEPVVRTDSLPESARRASEASVCFKSCSDRQLTPPMSAYGPELTSRDVRYESAMETEAEVARTSREDRS